MWAVGLITLAACSDNSNGPPTTTTSVTQLPASVLTLPPGGSLQAYISVDGGTRQAMDIDLVAHTATATIPNLSRGTHTISIEYEFTDSSNNTYTVATVEQTVDLSAGDASIEIAANAYNTNYDDDNDGLTNAQELAAGTSPVDSACVFGVSLIGSCTL